MMLLLVFYDVRSEREPAQTIAERLDWLWYLDDDLDDHIPNHSLLTKAGARWGVAAFKTFLERIVLQCQQAGFIKRTLDLYCHFFAFSVIFNSGRLFSCTHSS
ncbi:MAG: hypothetical protein GY850_17720 [bacterium]|nr:hypothetical protein [bacterium]